MSTTTQTQPVKSNVAQNVEVNLDEIFNAAPSGADMIQDDKQPKNIFSGLQEKADMTFADPDDDGATDVLAKSEKKDEATEEVTDESAQDGAEEKTKTSTDSVEEIFGELGQEETEEEIETKERRGRKSINGISDVFGKLIKDDKIVPFDDEKDLEDYSAKDFDRPVANEMLHYAKKNKTKIDYLLITSWDRFSRNTFEALRVIEELKKLNITVNSIDSWVDYDDPAQIMIQLMYLGMPEVDNKVRSQKVKIGMRQGLKEGR